MPKTKVAIRVNNENGDDDGLSIHPVKQVLLIPCLFIV